MSASSPSRAEFADEYPFASHYLDLDGHKYHYVDEGRGPTLLMVHGNPTWSFIWRNLIKDLSRDYRIVAVDHMGCGFSDKPQNYDYRLDQHIQNLTQLIKRLDLRDITLFGHDWGGCIGMGAAGRDPDRFSRFVLMNTGAFRSQRIPWRIAVCRIPILGSLGVRGLNLFSRAALRMAVVNPSSLSPAVRAGYLAPYGSWNDRIAVDRFVKDIPLDPTHPSYETLVKVETGLSQFAKHPLLLLWGEHDWCFTLEFLKEFQTRFPQAQTLRFPQAGHYLFEEAGPKFADGIRGFLSNTW